MELEISHYWLIATIVFFMAELFMPTFILISIAIGCFFASMTAFVGGGLPLQLSMFILGTVGGFVGIKPLFHNYIYKKDSLKSNVFGLTGRIGKIVRLIEDDSSYFEVAVDGDVWKAEGIEGHSYQTGMKVEVLKIDSIILTVKPMLIKELDIDKHHEGENNHHLEKILISIGSKKVLVELDQILCLYSEEKMTYLVSSEHKQYIVDDSLEKLMLRLPLDQFFRANRQFIISLKCIEQVIPSLNGKLVLKLIHEDLLPEKITVSRLKSAAFRKWMKKQC